jgi:ADP-ribose pyrophosphatase YjhB (NUDIX family)
MNLTECIGRHQYCQACGAEALSAVRRDDRELYVCGVCGTESPRMYMVDAETHWWLTPEGQYWHETAGVLVQNPRGEILLFERVKFPFGLTPPAGHVNAGEMPAEAAARELFEEVGLRGELVAFGAEDITGDACRRGADGHRWYSFGLRVTDFPEVQVEDEGVRPVWLAYDDAMAADLTLATRVVLVRYEAELRGAR